MFKMLYADLENEGLIMEIDEKELKAKMKNLKDVYRPVNTRLYTSDFAS
jgi:hypothetical protein